MTNNKREEKQVHTYNHIDTKNVHIREVILANRDGKKPSTVHYKRIHFKQKPLDRNSECSPRGDVHSRRFFCVGISYMYTTSTIY